ncbi:MAG: hypothetical protein KAI17_20690 [Thiotrichaceae bacterium]|nr:hypothetical protein [Thiotrichaceae bacterium]
MSFIHHEEHEGFSSLRLNSFSHTLYFHLRALRELRGDLSLGFFIYAE